MGSSFVDVFDILADSGIDVFGRDDVADVNAFIRDVDRDVGDGVAERGGRVVGEGAGSVVEIPVLLVNSG